MLENDVERALREESRAGRGSLRITPVESSLVSDGNLYQFFMIVGVREIALCTWVLRGVV